MSGNRASHSIWPESDSDRERTKRQRSSSRAYLSDSLPRPSTSSSAHKAQPFGQYQSVLATKHSTHTPTPEQYRNNTENVDPRPQGSKRNRYDKSLYIHPNEPPSSADEAGRTARREKTPKPTQHAVYPTTATPTDQVAWAIYERTSYMNASAPAPRDNDREDRKLKSREERHRDREERARLREERARVDSKAKAEQEHLQSSRGKPDVDYVNRIPKVERAPSAKAPEFFETKANEYDSSDSSRRKMAPATAVRKSSRHRLPPDDPTNYAQPPDPLQQSSRPLSRVTTWMTAAETPDLYGSYPQPALTPVPAPMQVSNSAQSNAKPNKSDRTPVQYAQQTSMYPTASYPSDYLQPPTAVPKHSSSHSTARAPSPAPPRRPTPPPTAAEKAAFSDAEKDIILVERERDRERKREKEKRRERREREKQKEREKEQQVLAASSKPNNVSSSYRERDRSALAVPPHYQSQTLSGSDTERERASRKEARHHRPHASVLRPNTSNPPAAPPGLDSARVEYQRGVGYAEYPSGYAEPSRVQEYMQPSRNSTAMHKDHHNTLPRSAGKVKTEPSPSGYPTHISSSQPVNSANYSPPDRTLKSAPKAATTTPIYNDYSPPQISSRHGHERSRQEKTNTAPPQFPVPTVHRGQTSTANYHPRADTYPTYPADRFPHEEQGQTPSPAPPSAPVMAQAPSKSSSGHQVDASRQITVDGLQRHDMNSQGNGVPTGTNQPRQGTFPIPVSRTPSGNSQMPESYSNSNPYHQSATQNSSYPSTNGKNNVLPSATPIPSLETPQYHQSQQYQQSYAPSRHDAPYTQEYPQRLSNVYSYPTTISPTYNDVNSQKTTNQTPVGPINAATPIHSRTPSHDNAVKSGDSPPNGRQFLSTPQPQTSHRPQPLDLSRTQQGNVEQVSSAQSRSQNAPTPVPQQSQSAGPTVTRFAEAAPHPPSYATHTPTPQTHSRSHSQPNAGTVRSTTAQTAPVAARPSSRLTFPAQDVPGLSLSSSPDSYEEVLMTPSSLGPTLSLKPEQTVPVPVEAPETRKKGIFGIFRSSSRTAKTADILAPSTTHHQHDYASRERERDRERGSRSKTHRSVTVPLVRAEHSQPQPAKIRKPAPIRIPDSKLSIPFRLFSKRNRTMSVASLEAVNGTATNTVVGSPRSSVTASTRGPMPSPPIRDPFMAMEEWRKQEEQDLMERGTERRRRPGVVFDVSDDDGVAHGDGARYRRSRISRLKARSGFVSDV